MERNDVTTNITLLSPMPSRIQWQSKKSWTMQIFDWRREEKNTCEWVSLSGPKHDEKLSRRRT